MISRYFNVFSKYFGFYLSIYLLHYCIILFLFDFPHNQLKTKFLQYSVCQLIKMKTLQGYIIFDTRAKAKWNVFFKPVNHFGGLKLI